MAGAGGDSNPGGARKARIRLPNGPFFSFTVNADCALTTMKKLSANSHKGLLAGGNWIIDQVKLIDVWPQPETLTNIRSQSLGTGGAPYNVLVDLAKSGVPFPLYGAGLVGKDGLGQQILHTCKEHAIDTRYIASTPKAPTSFTDVMTEQRTGRRTFFHARGANALWRGAEIQFDKTKPRIFHLGYLLLLDALDEPCLLYTSDAADERS